MFLDTLLKYLFAAVLIFTPLYPKFPLFMVFKSSVAIRAEDFLLFATAIVFLGVWIKGKRKFPSLSLQTAVWFATGLLACGSAIYLTKTVDPKLSLLHFLRRFEYISIFFTAMYLAKSQSNRRFFFELLIYPSLGVFLYALAQIYLHAPVISTMNSEFSKGVALTLQPGVQLSSTFGGHYDLAIYLVIIMSILTAAICQYKNISFKVFLTLFFILLLWLFMQAGSRISLFSIFIVVWYVAYRYRQWYWGAALSLLILLAIFTSSNLVNRIQNLIKIIPIKIESQLTPPALAADKIDRSIQNDRSTSIRLDVEWPMAIRSVKKNPLLGTGYSSLGLATDNDYLRALGETGIIGFIAFLSLLISLGRKIFTTTSSPNTIDKIINTSGQAVFLAILSTALFLDVFESSKIAIMFWSLSGLTLGSKQ